MDAPPPPPPPELCARIVAHLSQPALRESCNSVLRAEAGDVGARVKSATEALRRLREVAAAVAKLQRDKEDRRRSASLMALLIETERLHDDMEKEMDGLLEARASATAARGAAASAVNRRAVPARPTATAPASKARRSHRSDAAVRRTASNERTRVLELNSELRKLLPSKREAIPPAVRSASSGPESSEHEASGCEGSGNDGGDGSESSHGSSSGSSDGSSDGGESSSGSESSEESSSEQVGRRSSIHVGGSVEKSSSTSVADRSDVVERAAPVARATAVAPADASENSSNESDSDATDPYDWIKELTWDVSEGGTAPSKASEEGAVAKKSSSDSQGMKQEVSVSLQAFAQSHLDNIKHALANGSLKTADELLRRLIKGLQDRPDDEVCSDSMMGVVADAISRVSSVWTSAAMNFLELFQARELVSMIDELCKAHPALRSSLRWVRTRVVNVATMVNRNPKLHQDILPFLCLVLDCDELSPAHRCERLGNVTLSIASVMSSKLSRSDPIVLDQLALALKLVSSWICALPPELKTPSNFGAIRAFRSTVLQHINKFSSKAYLEGVKKMMEAVDRVLLEADESESKRMPAPNPSTVSVPMGKNQCKVARFAKTKPPAASGVSESGLYVLELEKRLRLLPSDARARRIDELIAAIIGAFQVRSEANVSKESGRLTIPIKHAVEWILEKPLDTSKLERYRSFVRSTQAFGKRIHNAGNRAGFLRLIEPLSKKVERLQPTEEI